MRACNGAKSMHTGHLISGIKLFLAINSRLSLGTCDDCRIFVWRRFGEELSDKCLNTKTKYFQLHLGLYDFPRRC